MDKILTAPANPAHIDKQRYRKVRRFFIKALCYVVWADIILNRPGLRRFRSPTGPRWQKLAREYRILTVDMGGLLIKLGQFLSIHVDILPREVTDELSTLQDSVPPAPFRAIQQQIENDFQQPMAKTFAWVSPEVVGAASLAQTHLACLPTGQEVVLKVLRPGIETLIETDLTVISQVVRWLKYYPKINQLVNVDALIHEFTTVTRRELDFDSEGHNIEQFAQKFANHPQVYTPKVYWDYTTGHILTMENVAYLKSDDIAAIQASGISCTRVAETLVQVYLQQFLVTNFVHADPHPGNLFIKPLPHPGELDSSGHPRRSFAPDDPVPFFPNRPFQIAFVDFGMAVTIPEKQQDLIREYVIGLGLRDAQRLVDAFVEGNVLLPNTDLQQLQQTLQAILDNFWGVMILQFKDVDLKEYGEFLFQEHRDFINHLPIQYQADLLFVFRAMEVLGGLVNKLAPDFDVWQEVTPFAQNLLRQEAERNWQQWPQKTAEFARVLIALPELLVEVLTRAKQGKLTFPTTLSETDQQKIQHVQDSVNRLAWIIGAVGLLLVGTLWHIGYLIVGTLNQTNITNYTGVGIMVIAACVLIWGLLKT